jgi:hypothetical protein
MIEPMQSIPVAAPDRVGQLLSVLRSGGTLVLHAETLADLKRQSDPMTWLTVLIAESEKRVIPNDLVVPGILYAIEARN